MFGFLPIHIVCQNRKGATLEMVNELLSAHPQGINEEDRMAEEVRGRTYSL
jgi:hypothetical protein